jgi:hypothetical protein
VYLILVRRRRGGDLEVGRGLERRDVLHLFFTLHNAVNVAHDPVPLLVPLGDGREAFVYAQEVSALRLFENGVDVTGRMLVEG